MVYRRTDSLDEHASREGFAEVTDATRVARLSPGCRLVVGRNEDDRQTGTFTFEAFLEVEAGHTPKLDVCDEQPGVVMARVLQE